MNRSLSALLFAFALAPALAQAPSQPVGPEAATAPVLHTQARLVSVDVVVTDRDHHPVHDLRQQDFTVSENNHPQAIGSFAEYKATPSAPTVKPAPMPPGYFSNETPSPNSRAVNILLLDALNTPMQDQLFLHKQLLDFLKNSPPGNNTAVFGLASRLVLLQPFSTDPTILKNALEKQTAKASSHLGDVIGGNSTPDTAADVNQNMDDVLSAAQVANLQTFLDMQQSFQTMVRVKNTLDAMNVLARWLATIPGRKNLIWFSGSFPLNILPDATRTASNGFAQVQDAEDEYRETSDLLARAQVAVYPIDMRGLMVQPSAGGAMEGTKGVRTANGHGNAFTNSDVQFFLSQSDEHATMQRMADDTGGRAFFNTNNLAEAVNRAVDDGSSFYTLTYSPTDKDWKGEFRRIHVALAREGYTLEYRRGYYADSPKSAMNATLMPSTDTSKPDANLIVKNMVHAVPGATQVLYKLRVLPTYNAPEDAVVPGNLFNEAKKNGLQGPFRRYSVDYAVLPTHLTFLKTPDGKHHTTIAFVCIVYDRDGQLVNRIARSIPATLTEEQYQHVLQKGFPFHQEISVPVKGDFSIRTGVHDIRSNQIGSTEIPVSLVQGLPPVNAMAPPSSSPDPTHP